MPTAESAICVVLVYPELLGTYGDRGNALALTHRAAGRGLPARVVEVRLGDPLPRTGDVYLIGGSEDAMQALALEALQALPDAADVLAAAPACLAVCAGLQLLSSGFTGPRGDRVAGLGLLDVECRRLPQRAVGEVVAAAAGVPGLPALTGYENHQGSATVGPAARPLGGVVRGTGNGDGTEGAVQDRVVATYLHGPVLVRNPALADHLLARVHPELPPYDDEPVLRLRRERLGAADRSAPVTRAGLVRRLGTVGRIRPRRTA